MRNSSACLKARCKQNLLAMMFLLHSPEGARRHDLSRSAALLLLLFSSGAWSRIICDWPRWGQHPSGNWVLLRVHWTEKWWDHGGCVHLPISDIQSLSVPASPLPDHIADMWPVQTGLGFSLFCCSTMPTLVKRESRVLCEGVKSFSWSLFTYMAWCTAGLAMLLHLWASDDCFSSAKVHGAAECDNVEASFATLSARMFPSIPQWPGFHWNVMCALPPAAICSTSESTWCTISSFPVSMQIDTDSTHYPAQITIAPIGIQ